MVSSGCGGAMMLAAAAALAGDDVAAIEALPDTSSLAKDEILIMKRQRYKFDRCFEAAGAKLVDWGNATGPISIDEMVASLANECIASPLCLCVSLRILSLCFIAIARIRSLPSAREPAPLSMLRMRTTQTRTRTTIRRALCQTCRS